ncbi:flagellar motor stator protein MotA [Thiomicrospira microaerophila]|uniref:motility-associated protein n=1 Tax=Thiomicrospira microaerophila TaxID=406020 RepID=UPI00200D5118|nr:motility-associated protein [Thiomicrospira microaerophila]UQB42839.1 flagellar motor stator protein MotA [Thiomicrospira microaerophila]
MSTLAKPFGIIIVFLSFLGGFLLMGGNLSAIWHPAELVVILGIALGAFMLSAPMHVWFATLASVGRVFGGEPVNKKLYAEALGLLDELVRTGRASGILALEKHIFVPDSSPIFRNYPRVLKHRVLKKFVIDNFSYLLLNPPQSQSFESHLIEQIDAIYNSRMEVPKATGKIADWMPGFGIIAAIMGVIMTMTLLGGEMDVALIGQSVGAALVGTLMGIFLAFAFVAPFTHFLEVMNRQERALLEMIAAYLDAYANGVSPSLAVEIARQRIPPEYELPRN